MTTEVGNQPIVNVVWYIQICHLIDKGIVAHVVKSLTEVKTIECVVRSRVTVCKIKISAAVVEPVGRKA